MILLEFTDIIFFNDLHDDMWYDMLAKIHCLVLEWNSISTKGPFY